MQRETWRNGILSWKEENNEVEGGKRDKNTKDSKPILMNMMVLSMACVFYSRENINSARLCQCFNN